MGVVFDVDEVEFNEFVVVELFLEFFEEFGCEFGFFDFDDGFKGLVLVVEIGFLCVGEREIVYGRRGGRVVGSE